MGAHMVSQVQVGTSPVSMWATVIAIFVLKMDYSSIKTALKASNIDNNQWKVSLMVATVQILFLNVTNDLVATQNVSFA